ncbi:hypothetical protein IC582_008903 [Cucumis melo]
MTLLQISSFSYTQPCCGRLMTSRRMVTYQGGVRRGIRHVLYAWVIDRHSGYEVEYLSWDIDAKFSDGFVSNISRCVHEREGKISGLKTHDCHVLLYRLLPIGIRAFLPKNVYTAITESCNFFRDLCARTIRVSDLDRLQADIIIILCKLERIFLLAFFSVMVHLAVHLPYETKITGPVSYSWMYPIERGLRTLKQYVRNKARPEGSIAEAYVMNESSTFCSRYLRGIETRFTR